MNKNDIQLTTTLIFTALFVGSIMYAMWMADDPSICKRKACLVMAWGIKAAIIGMPIGVAISVLVILRQPYEPYQEPQKPKEESFDYSKMGANNERPFKPGVEHE